MNNKQEQSSGRATTVISRVLEDGLIVELVYSPKEKKTRLAVGKGDDVSVVEYVKVENAETLIPVPATNNLIRHSVVLLPEHPTPYASDEELIFEIHEYIDRYLDLSPAFREVATSYILLSWVYDAFNELPYLRFRGDFGTGKTRALSIIGSIAYKGFFASGASTISPIFYTLDFFRGTLVLDESDFRFSDEKAELSKILNNGNVDGFPVLRQTVNAKKEFDPRPFRIYGPKIVAARDSFEDQALESRFLTEDMGRQPIRREIPFNLPDSQKDEALALRNKLLMYRFLKLKSVSVSVEDGSAKRSARTNQIIVPLLSVAATPEAKRAINAVAQGIEDELASDRADLTEAALLRAILTLWGERPNAPLLVSAIAKELAGELGTNTERSITPKYVGYLLRKRLRLSTRRVSGAYILPISEQGAVSCMKTRFGLE